MGVCTECHANTRPGEYHPYAFCVLQKAGLDPWQEVRLIAAHLQLKPDLGEGPPIIWVTPTAETRAALTDQEKR